MSMRGDSKTTQRVAVPDSTTEDASSAARSLHAADFAAGACGITPHSHAGLEIGVSYSGESDVSDSGNAQEASRLPMVPCPSRAQPNERTRDLITVCLAAMMRMITHHHGQLVDLLTSALMMERAVVILKTVVPAKVPR